MATLVNKEIVMNTQLSSRFAAIAIAIAVNSTMIGAVAVLFNAHSQAHAVALVRIASATGFFI